MYLYGDKGEKIRIPAKKKRRPVAIREGYALSSDPAPSDSEGSCAAKTWYIVAIVLSIVLLLLVLIYLSITP